MSEEEFFEGLRKRAIGKSERYLDGDIHAEGVDATIEALKEAMVGEPMEGKIEHTSDSTWILDRRVLRAKMPGLHGTDGEGVWVIVAGKGAD